MIVSRAGLVPCCLALLQVVGCGGAARNQRIGVDCVGTQSGRAECQEESASAASGSSVAGASSDQRGQPGRSARAGSRPTLPESKSTPGKPAVADAGEKAGDPAGAAEPPAPPSYEPGRVRQALDATASAPDERTRLGLRLAIVDQGPNAPWLVAIANRGTEPVRVNPDLRTLSLEITPKAPEPPQNAKYHRPVKPPKPVTCTLPRDLFPSVEDPNLRTQLEPGEAVVDGFDPRLYCLSWTGTSPLKPGARVVARLGWPEKTKTVWKAGKSEKVLVAQAPPFVAERLSGSTERDAGPASAPNDQSSSAAPGTAESSLLKQLVSASIELGPDYAEAPPEADSEPLALQLTRGSDARTERDATLAVSIVNRSKSTQRVFFRRELLSFEISGPRGLVTCEPGPDDRAPDRRAFQSLRPGGRISATSRLVELCPAGAMRSPGLYLVHARFEAREEDAGEGSQPAYHGRLLSQKPVSIRVRRGWGVLPPQHEPMKVRLGTP
ncbi:MAG TPA: hypothetical protein VFQ61_24360 [Polyangiaceae bacterium]|nr:hypothetical protein [Polyangiaceae bacterium]